MEPELTHKWAAVLREITHAEPEHPEDPVV